MKAYKEWDNSKRLNAVTESNRDSQRDYNTNADDKRMRVEGERIGSDIAMHKALGFGNRESARATGYLKEDDEDYAQQRSRSNSASFSHSDSVKKPLLERDSADESEHDSPTVH